MPRLLTAILLIALVGTGCSGEESAGERRAFGSGEDFSVVAALGELPMEYACEDEISRTNISVTDYDTASKIAEHPPPKGSEDDTEILDWLIAISGEPTDLMTYPWRFDAAVWHPAEFSAEVGFGFADLDAIVESTTTAVGSWSGPVTLVVVNELDVATEVDVQPGVLTIGEGADLENDVENRTAARRLGQPLRLAVDGDRVFFNELTPIVQAWLDPSTQRCDENSELLAAATLLDARNAIAAQLRQAAGTDDNLGFADRPGLAVGYRTVGIGWGVDDDGESVFSVVYVFADEETALHGETGVETFMTSDAMPDRVIVNELRRVDNMVEVVLSVTPGSTAAPDSVKPGLSRTTLEMITYLDEGA